MRQEPKLRSQLCPPLSDLEVAVMRTFLALLCGMCSVFTSGAIGYAQNTVDVVPCSSSSLCTPGPPIQTSEYYDLSIESVCIDKPDTFWHRKVISLEVDVTVGTHSTIKVPVYKDRVGNGCHLGANGVALANFVPDNGQGVAIQSSIYRSDESDGLKRILSLATTTAQNPALTNFAGSAMPYVGLAADFANQAYAAFGQPTTPWLNESPSRLHPAGAQYDRYDLREGYFVQYAGHDNPADSDLYVESGDLHWRSNGSLLRGGSVWILFKIRRIERRTDYTLSNWYLSWDSLLDDCYQGSVDAESFTRRAEQALTLLRSDTDYTAGDRDQYVRDYTAIEDRILIALNSTPPDIHVVRAAIDASRSPVRPAGTWVASDQVSDTPTASTVTVPEKYAIVPSKLAVQLTDMVK
jgi:hypothetical protein